MTQDANTEADTPVSLSEGHVTYANQGVTNGGFDAGEDVDGLVPVDEIDNEAPRAFFPWIEQAADTKL